MDLSKLSDAELDALEKQDSGPDLSHLSDAELDELDREPSAMESAVHGAMKGASLGFIDELSGLGEAAGRAVGLRGMGGKFSDLEFAKPDLNFSQNYEEGRDKKRALHSKLAEANPASYTTGEVAGGLSTAVVPGLNAAKGLRGAVATGAALGGATGFGNSEAKDAQGLAIDTLSGTALGGTLGGGLNFAGQGVQKATNFVSSKVAPSIEKMLPIGKKANSAEIEAAAKRLGFEATPGMTNASEKVQALEDSLRQAPTIGGWLTRRGTEPVKKGMEGATKDLISDAATVSPYESGEAVKKILAKEVEGKFAPSKAIFEDLKQYTKDIPSTPTSTKAVARNIMSIPEVETLELPLARQVVKQLEKNPSVDQIKTLRTMVGKKATGAADGAEKSAYWQIYAKLGKLEENTLKRGVISSARTSGEGNDIAKGMLGQLKGAKRGYAEQMGNLEDLSQAARLGKSSGPSGFTEKIDSIPSERLQEKLLPLEDVRLAQTVQKQFPEAFGTLRKARIRDIADGVEVGQDVLPGKLLQKTKNLNPEAEQMLFGDKVGKLTDLRSVNQALPDKVGPSGTSQALDMKDWWRPDVQARDLIRFGAYKATSSDTMNKVAQFLRSQPKFANMAEQNPKAFQAAVYQFANRVNPAGGISKAAGYNAEPVSDEKAREAFLDQ